MVDMVLGIDGGGTKTAATLICLHDDPLRQLGAGTSGPSNIAAVTVQSAFDAICAAASEALSGVDGHLRAICIGVAGYSHIQRRADLSQRLAKSFPGVLMEVVPDYAIAFDAALNGQPGVLVISGTGQIAYGENAAGKWHRAGGYGYLIDDAGSGYGVGRAALAATLAAQDGSGPLTALGSAICRRVGVSQLEDVVSEVYGGKIDRQTIASLAEAVSDCAASGDMVAQEILATAGAALSRIALAVIDQLFTKSETVALATVGSLWKAHSSLSDAFETGLIDSGRHTIRCASVTSPELGAALRARKLAQC
ncbi:MAG TPA: BadF/BadG/BcrA/BcrD ATPase family protein [Capsulimonadaceae bacterium]|jgi:N-acetylglucosamine kinase-like BadF-type ATPase